MTSAERFRALHEGSKPFILPNPGDPGTARLLQQAGFEALATSSAAVAFALGVPDGHVPRKTMMRHIMEITSSTSLPVSADLGDGFGREPETVAATIRMAAEAGAVGGSIEDASADAQGTLLPLSLAVERVAAAVEAARALPFPFTLTARAEHYLVGCPNLDDVLTRLAAYRRAGADVLYAPALPDEDAVAVAVQVAAPCPLNVLAQGQGVASSYDRLASLGVRRISLGSALTRLAFTSILGAIDELRQGSFTCLRSAVPLPKLNGMFADAVEEGIGTLEPPSKAS